MGLRIGFAYNEKPAESAEPPSSALREGVAEEAEPPSGPAQAWVAEDSEPPSRPHHSSHDRFAEWDEPETIAAVEAALRRVGSVIRLEADADFPRKLRDTNPDIVFNIAEGLNGPNREAHVPAICEFYGVPYSGSDVLTLALALDKRRAKEVFAARGVPTAPFVALHPDGPSALPAGFPLPAVVKPVHEGSSMGIPERAFCRTPEEVHRRVEEIAETYRQPALVETFLPGREFTVAVLGNGLEASTLPIVEIRFDALPPGALPLYGYEAKWVWDTTEKPLEIFDCPARLTPSLAGAIGAAALGAYEALGCRDWSRVDLRLDADGRPNVIEINPLPGILPDPRQNSCFPKAARAAGIGYDDLICTVLELAMRRCGVSR